MNTVLQRLRTFSQNLGLVEQAQIVASTAVIVTIVTIITANIVLDKIIGFVEFISIVTVGVIGFTSVYFSLKYGRQLEEQRKELVALNAIANEVNQAINIEYIFNNTLNTIARFVKAEYGWLYINEKETLFLKNSYGTEKKFLIEKTAINIASIPQFLNIHVQEKNSLFPSFLEPRLSTLHIGSWVSIPLKSGEEFAGIVILASKNNNFFTQKKIDLIVAFCNHISVALNNARLFEQVQQSEKKYYELFEFLPDMYYVVNNEGIIISCNETEAKTLGYTKTDIIGQPLSFLYPETLHNQVKAILYNAFTLHKELHDQEEQMVKADGTYIDVSTNTSLVYDVHSKPILMRCVSRNITEKKKLEQQIIHSQKIDSIGNLAGGIAHDFNNILTSIIGATSIIQRKITKRNKLFPLFSVVETAAQRGATLTQQLLTFARKSTVEFHPLDIHLLIDETIDIFKPSITAPISILKKYSHSAIVINGDKSRLQQALLNIFINARDAMANGGTLTVETLLTSSPPDKIPSVSKIDDNEYAVLKITDSGTGISKDIQNKIFEPFFTTKEEGKGTGLGLSIVYGIILSHNGTISVHSEPKKGTTFTIILPALVEKNVQSQRKTSEKITGGKESILIIDEEMPVLVTTEAMLQELGYNVHSAHGGKNAIQLLSRKKKFDVIVLDMIMSQISGEELFQKIKKSNSATKIIISSGYTNKDLEKDTFLRKADGFLKKPYRVEELAKKLREVIEKP